MKLPRALPALPVLALLALAACGEPVRSSSDAVDVELADEAIPESVDTASPFIEPHVTPDSLRLSPFGPPAAPSLPAGVRLRAATWNVYGGQWATFDELGATIAGLQADLVGLEECPEGAAATLAEVAGFPYVEQVAGQALLSKTPLADAESVSLGAEGRAALHATTTVQGALFSVYVAHVSWNVAGNLQCRQFAEVLASDPVDRLVVVGDFNDEAHSTQITYLDVVLADAFTAAGVYPGQLISWPSHWFDETEGAQLIDLVFFRRAFPALVLEAGVTELLPPRSDHKPAWADLLYPAGGEAAFSADPFAALRDPFGAFPPEDERPPNLLQNPGAESGLAGWSVEGDPRAEALREQRTPHGGAAFFTGYPKTTGKVMRSSGSQQVSLSSYAEAIDAGRGVVYASAWLATGYLTVSEGDEVSNLCKPYDDAEVLVEALDADSHPRLVRSSGRHDTLGWVPWAEVLDLPPGTRTVRVTWAMNRKVQSGFGNDGAVDDLYLGYATLGAPQARLGGDLLGNGGAEEPTPEGWEGSGFEVSPNDVVLGPWGGTVFPPWSWSGRGFFVAPAPMLSAAAPVPELRRELDLDRYAGHQAAGTLALRWGGWLRTFESRTPWTLRLVLEDGHGVWGEIVADPVFAAAWTGVEALTRIPAGTTRVTFVLRGPEPSETRDAGFADSLFAWPERVAPSFGR